MVLLDFIVNTVDVVHVCCHTSVGNGSIVDSICYGVIIAIIVVVLIVVVVTDVVVFVTVVVADVVIVDVVVVVVTCEQVVGTVPYNRR